MTEATARVYRADGVTDSAQSKDASSALLSPAKFFEEVLPRAFEAEPGETDAAEEIRLQYRIVGQNGGDWFVRLRGASMTVERTASEALISYSLSAAHAVEAINAIHGASPLLIIPRPPDRGGGGSGAIRALHGTLFLRLVRAPADPFLLEICFNGAKTPRTELEMSLADYVAMQERRLSAKEAFTSGRMHVDGDMPFLMQVGMATSL